MGASVVYGRGAPSFEGRACVKPSIQSLCLALTALVVGTATLAPAQAAPYPYPTTVPAQSQPFTRDMEERIQRGEIVVTLINRHPIYHLDVYGAVMAPPHEVWEAITTYDAFREFLPLVSESYLRKRTGQVAHQYIKMNPPWPFHDQWMVNVHTEDKRRWNLSWYQGDGNVKLEHGYWQLTPMTDGRTKLQYHLTVDPWMDQMPGWVVEWVTRSVMPDVVKGVRKRVASNQRAKR